MAIARHFIIGKLYNQRWLLERVTRDNPLRVNIEQFKQISSELKNTLKRFKI